MHVQIELKHVKRNVTRSCFVAIEAIAVLATIHENSENEKNSPDAHSPQNREGHRNYFIFLLIDRGR